MRKRRYVTRSWWRRNDTMKASTICLVSSIICFAIGATIFILALFARVLDPKVAGGVGAVFIMAFLGLTIANILLRNKELTEEKK